jgi:hypothetical protein
MSLRCRQPLQNTQFRRVGNERMCEVTERMRTATTFVSMQKGETPGAGIAV